MTLEDFLARLERLDAEATKGPWEWTYLWDPETQMDPGEDSNSIADLQNEALVEGVKP